MGGTRTARSAGIIFLVVLILGAMGTWSMVRYAEYCIKRGARWNGISFDRGIALVFTCQPGSGIRRALFYVWPWKKVEMEKVPSGA